MENTFQSKKNLAWFAGKYFPFILGEKHFSEVVKNLEISYYLLIISNLVIKLYIFCFASFFFNFIPYNLIFILILVLIFMIVIYFSFIIFFN
jgi:hypothetical protein